MSLHRRNPRRDSNERIIVQALEAQGFNVVRLSGAGVPDLVITKAGRNWFCEVKTAKGKYKPAQLAFYERWTGPAIVTLRTVEDALKIMLLACENSEKC
jgi:Holliday junction resolvase